jgi:8-oxo-dGTP pyrophosphatase MutT (NUDIX family)
VVAAVYAWRQGSGGCVIGGVVGAGFVLALLAFVAAERIHRAHEDRLAEAYLMLSRHSILDEVAAAVCYRRTTNAVQFLLVRTKGGRYWTFPKGHIKKKERDRPWEAARREASEEAGVRGTVRQLPLAYYRYPAKGEKASGAHYRVAAYLLEVSGPLGVHEDGRDPTWCAAPEAKARLMEGGREKIYVTEQQLVIDAALGALGVAG